MTLFTNRLILVGKTYLARDVLELTCKTDKTLDYIPGQYLVFELGENIYRSYSIADSNPYNEYKFLIKLHSGGVASTILASLNVNSSLAYFGPEGDFSFRSDICGKQVLVAAGTGIAPFRAMISEIRMAATKQLVYLIHGVKTFDQAAYYHDFMTLTKEFPNLTYWVYLSEQSVPIEYPNVFIGRVQQGLKKVGTLNKRDMLYLCGTPSMVHEVFRRYSETSEVNITMERFE